MATRAINIKNIKNTKINKKVIAKLTNNLKLLKF